MKYLRPLFILLCATITTFYFVGLLFFLADHKLDPKCEMTYMFEYPQFVRVSQEIDHKYPKYSLYAYGEGRLTKNARNMYFDGIPVLFIPGNAGAHQQVRSLSSVALRKTLNSGYNYHFDYFTVNLNSEYSALYGPVLYDQLDYVLNSIDRILELYKNSPSSPQQVVLIGHSVGGIVAKKAITELQKTRRNLVSVLITLAAPIQRAPLYFDRQISAFYKTSSFGKGSVITISIGGGHSDFLVPSYLTEHEGNSTVNVVATNIPKAWVESNHVQIVWCKQVVLAINRALFDSVDRKSHQISTNTDLVKKVFRHHLIYNSGTEHHLKLQFHKLTKINYKGEWIENLYKQYSIDHKKGVKTTHWYMVALTALPTYEMLTVLAVNLEVSDWVFVCNAAFPNGGSRVCVEAEHLSQYSEIVPTSRFKRRLVTINMHELKKNNTEYTHVVFRALQTSKPVTFHADIYGSFERKIEISLPRFSLKKQIIMSQTPEKALIYDIILLELENLLQVYQLFVEPVHCSSDQHHATASLIVPWANENIHSHFTENLNRPLTMRLQNSRPRNAGVVAKVRLILEPTCTYQISVRLHILGVFGQIARYYSPFLVTNVAVVFLLGLQNQFSKMDQTGTVPIFFTAIMDGLKQSWIIPIVCLVSKIRYPPFLSNILPETEAMTVSKDSVNMIMPLLLFITSIVITCKLVAFYCVSLFTLESMVHKLTLKLLARTVTVTIRFSDYLMIFLQKVPFMVAVVLVFLCFTTCGGLALCVGMVFYFLKLTQMSQDYVEQVVWLVIKQLAKKCRTIFSKNEQENDDSPCEEPEKQGVIENLNKTCADNNSDGKNETDNEEPMSNVDPPQKSIGKAQNRNSIESDNDSVIDEDYTDKNCKDHMEQTTDTRAQNKNQETEWMCKPVAKSKNDITENLSLSNNAIFFHSSMFFMWVFITVLNIPAILTWAHNFKFDTRLVPDESFLPGLVLSLSALPLWQLDLPRINRRFTLHLRIVILCIVAISLLYATVSLYRLNYMLTILFALIMTQQCYAPMVGPENERERKQTENKYDDLKMKME